MAAACPGDSNSEVRSNNSKDALLLLDEKSLAHLFFTWTIENIHLMPEDKQKFIISPPFHVQSVSSDWILSFFLYDNLNDRKCARFDMFRRNFNEANNIIKVTYRIGIRISDVDTWFQEKRAVSFQPSDLSRTVFYIRDFFSNDDVFHQNTMIVLCEMYLSLETTDETAWKKEFSVDTRDLLHLSMDISKSCTKFEESDTAIIIKNLTYPCYKTILSARSPVFARLLEDKHSNIKLKDEDSSHILNILGYIYSGCLPAFTNNSQLCIGLYECAKRNSINGLEELLEPTEISGRTSISVEKINFTWTIENFSTLTLEANQCIVSPVFNNEGKYASDWHLELYPKGRLETPNSVGIVVKNTEERKTIHVSIQISILDKNLSVRFKKCIDNIWVPRAVYGFPKFIDKMNLDEHLLENDQLILNCKIELLVQTSFLDKSSLIRYSSLVEHAGLEQLSKDFEKLLHNKIWKDVTIVIGNRKLRFHKYVLAARSPVFARRIKESGLLFKVTDVRRDIFDKLIYYLYTGKLQRPTPTIAMQLYEAAKNYEVNCLPRKCVLFLLRSLDTENFLDLFLFTDKHKIKILMIHCAKFFARKPEEILSTEWENFSLTKSEFLTKLFTWLYELHNDGQCSSKQ